MNPAMFHTLILVFLVIKVSVLTSQAVCPTGWIHHDESCYYLHFHAKYDWMESKGYCDIHHANLASIQDLSENIFIKGLIIQELKGVRDAHVWLGATDDIVEGNFTWYDTQSPVTFTDWGPGEPNSGPLHLVEDCLVYWAHYSWQWADLDCHQKAFFVCEKNSDSGSVIIG